VGTIRFGLADGVAMPTHPTEALVWLNGVGAPWWIAGGWALDLYAGTQTRPHADLDVGMLRRDAPAVLAALSDWEFFEVQGGVHSTLARGQAPRAAVNCLWGRPVGDSSWALELMLDDSSGDDWVYRRDPQIRRSLDSVIRWSAEHIPYLAPEIQLLYKSKAPREKDQADFERVAPRLDAAARGWLRDALKKQNPLHPWVPALIKIAA
jgi:hypothetical protein